MSKLKKGGLSLGKTSLLFKSKFTGNRNDVGDIKSGRLETAVSIPKEMDDPEKAQILMKCCLERPRPVIL